MPGNRVIVTLKHKESNETRTVEVTGGTHTQKSAEEHVAGQYGKNASGRAAAEARMWEVVPKQEDRKAAPGVVVVDGPNGPTRVATSTTDPK